MNYGDMQLKGLLEILKHEYLASYFVNWNITFLNKISLSIEQITWLYIGAIPLSLQ